MPWGLHTEKGTYTNETFQGLVDNLLTAIRVIERYQEKQSNTDSCSGMLYVGQKRYARHPVRSKPCPEMLHRHSTNNKIVSVQCITVLATDALTVGPPDGLFRAVRNLTTNRESNKTLSDGIKKRESINGTIKFSGMESLAVEAKETREAFMATLVLEKQETNVFVANEISGEPNTLQYYAVVHNLDCIEDEEKNVGRALDVRRTRSKGIEAPTTTECRCC